MKYKLLAFLAWLMVALWAAAALAQGRAADCTTPRRAIMTLIDNLQPERHDPATAAACFDFSQQRAEPQAQLRLAMDLKAVLDARGLFVYEERLPDDADYRDERSRQPLFAPFPDELPEVAVHQVQGRWLWTPRAIRATPTLYAETFALDLERLEPLLPEALKGRVFGVASWRLLALVLAVALAAIFSKLLEILLVGALRRSLRGRAEGLSRALTPEVTRPLTLLLMCGLLAPVIPALGLTVRLSVVALVALKVAATAAVLLVAWRMVDVLSRVMSARASRTDTRLDDQLVPLVRKTLKAALVVIAVLFILQNLDVDVGSLLAGLGIGGLAFALAAKDTLANFFGSLMIFVDRPFQIGDWVKLEGIEGTVEEVGFRSTRVRTFYQSLVTIPNSAVANTIIDNMGERRYRRLMLTLGITYGSSPDQVQAFVEGLRGLLRRNPAVWFEGTEVHFYNFGESALEILVYTFLKVPGWSEELRQRHNLLLEMQRLAEALGISFAFPSRSLYLESTPERPQRAAPPDRATLVSVVRGFGPGGELGKASGDPLTEGFGEAMGAERGPGDSA